MKVSILAYQVPAPEGTAPGRALYALCEGILALGHDVSVCSWWPHGRPAVLPDWCEWRELRLPSALVGRARALLRPRTEVLGVDWQPPDDAVAVADDVPSFPAVAPSVRSVATFHYLTRLDKTALGRRQLRDIQDERAEATVAQRAALVTAYSKRVAQLASSRAQFVPIACPMPEEPLTPVDEPVAMLLATWAWQPNRAALRSLLGAWPDVRSRVPAARLILAGRGLDELGVSSSDGVEVLGAVPSAIDALSQAAVVAFPCPDTSGPKVKVIEALSYGIPVLTTPAGVEGIELPEGAGAVVAPPERFAEALASLLVDPDRRRVLGSAGRRTVLAAHGPIPAARARLAVFQAAFEKGVSP